MSSTPMLANTTFLLTDLSPFLFSTTTMLCRVATLISLDLLSHSPLPSVYMRILPQHYEGYTAIVGHLFLFLAKPPVADDISEQAESSKPRPRPTRQVTPLTRRLSARFSLDFFIFSISPSLS